MEPKYPFANCAACPLKDMPHVASDPIKPDAKIIVVGESPGERELRAGQAFSGESGRLLWTVLGTRGFTREQTQVLNTVACWPGAAGEEKQELLDAARVCCAPRLDFELKERGSSHLPILTLGKTAREHFMGAEHEGELFTTLTGRWYRGTHGERVLSTLHPAFVIRTPTAAKDMFDDMAKFMRGWQDPPSSIVRIVITEKEHLLRVLKEAVTHPVIAYDIETTQVDFRYDDVTLLVFNFDGSTSYIVPGKHKQMPEEQRLLYSLDPEIRQAWVDFWGSSAEFVAHNGKFDSRFLRWQCGMKPRVDFDTILAHYALDERGGTHDLKTLAARLLNLHDYEKEIKAYLRSKSDNYGKIPWNVLCDYAAWDAWATFHLKHILEQRMKEEGTYEAPFKLVLSAFNMFVLGVEMHGVNIDVDYLEQMNEQFMAELESLREEISRLSDGNIENPASTQQVARFLFDIVGLGKVKNRRVKEGSTSKEALSALRGQHPIIPPLQRYRRIAKMKDAYIDNLLGYVDDVGRVHCDFIIFGTETGRISTRNPALQTIPRADDHEDGKYGKLIKDAFVAGPGRVLVNADFSQAELRVAAALSGEPFLIDVYEHDRDLHSEVAAAMFGPNYDKEQRNICKSFNFAYLYGGTAYSFADDLTGRGAGYKLDVKQAVEFVRKYDELMPRLAAWKEEQRKLMHAQGYVTSRFGRRRRIPFINNINKDDARKASFNAPDQGAASDLTLLAAMAVEPAVAHLNAHVVLTVHDSVIIDAPQEHAHEVAVIATRIMVATGNKYFPEVKWKADADAGEKWGSLKGIL